MIYLYAAVGLVLFFAVQYRIECVKKERRMRASVRENWGRFAQREFNDTEMEMIASYHRERAEGFVLDDITWHDLAMDEVFAALNRTYSSVGEEYFYHVLRTPQFSAEELARRGEMADLFAGNVRAREDVAFCLSRIGKNYRIPFTTYVTRLLDLNAQSNGVHLLTLGTLAAAVVLICFRPAYGVAFLAAAMAFGIASYYRKKGEVEPYFICIQRVLQLTDAGERIAALKIPELEELRGELGSIARRIRRRSSGAWMMRSGGAMGGSLLDILLDYLRMVTHLDLIVFNRISRAFRKDREEIFRLIELIGRLELGLLAASLREALPVWCRPELSDTAPCLRTEEMYHPLLEEPVTNSIDAGRNVLITGSNASGKSTFLKAVAVNAILAQTVGLAAAASWKSSRFRVYSSMALADNLFGGESYFIVEIRSLKRILDRMGGENVPVLCFIDEVLRGTNTVERIAASAQILKSLSGKPALCFAATHDTELTALLAPYYDNYHFTEEVQGNDVRFPYRLCAGPAKSRNAIRLLAAMGYGGELTAKAEETAERFLETGKWTL